MLPSENTPELTSIYNPETLNPAIPTPEHLDEFPTTSDSKRHDAPPVHTPELTEEAALTPTPHSHSFKPCAVASNPLKRKKMKQDGLKGKSKSLKKKHSSVDKVSGPKQALLSAYFSYDSSTSGDKASSRC